MSNNNSNFDEHLIDGSEHFKDFESGRCRLVIGKNGSGKTRLLSDICGYRKINGKIIVPLNFSEFKFTEQIENHDELYDLNMIFNKYDKNDVEDLDLEKLLMSIAISFEKNDYFKKKIDIDYTEYSELLLGAGNKFGVKKLNLMSDEKCQTFVNISTLEDYIKIMSPGQRNLLTMCVLLGWITYYYKDSNKLVFLIDEPEAHLHPLVVNKFIATLRKKFQLSEIWIASHSIQLMTLFKTENIIIVNNGVVVEKSDNTYHDLIIEMVGQDTLDEFLSDLISKDYIKYYMESTKSPNVARSLDSSKIGIMPQNWFIEKNILDYGSGNFLYGRAINNFGYTSEELVKQYKSDIFNGKIKLSKYNAFDLKEYQTEDKKRKFDNIKLNGLYYDEESIALSKDRFDYVLLVDAFHEIPFLKWDSILSMIYNKMKPDGILIYSEPYVLKYGEKPNKDGYIVLGPREIRILFETECHTLPCDNIDSNDIVRIYTYISKEKLHFYLQNAEKQSLAPINEKKLNVLKSMDERLPTEYQKAILASNYRRAAFFSIMHSNVRLLLNKLVEKNGIEDINSMSTIFNKIEQDASLLKEDGNEKDALLKLESLLYFNEKCNLLEESRLFSIYLDIIHLCKGINRIEKYCSIVLDLYESKDYVTSSDLAYIYERLGYVKEKRKRYSDAISYYNMSLKKHNYSNGVSSSSEEVGELLMNIGRSYESLNRDDLAEEYYINACKIYENSKANNKMSSIYKHISDFYRKIGTKSLESYYLSKSKEYEKTHWPKY